MIPEFPEINDIKGLRLTAFPPAILTPGERIYIPYIRRDLRRKIARMKIPDLLEKIPPVLVYNHALDSSALPPNIVLDGNHRAEAASYYDKPIPAILLETQDDLDACLCLTPQESISTLDDARYWLRHKRIYTIQDLREDVRKRLSIPLFKNFDEYREKAKKTKTFYERIMG